MKHLSASESRNAPLRYPSNFVVGAISTVFLSVHIVWDTSENISKMLQLHQKLQENFEEKSSLPHRNTTTTTLTAEQQRIFANICDNIQASLSTASTLINNMSPEILVCILRHLSNESLMAYRVSWTVEFDRFVDIVRMFVDTGMTLSHIWYWCEEWMSCVDARNDWIWAEMPSVFSSCRRRWMECCNE